MFLVRKVGMKNASANHDSVIRGGVFCRIFS